MDVSLLEACKCKSSDEAMSLIESGADVNVADEVQAQQRDQCIKIIARLLRIIVIA
eukprot:m.77474 g.77474  ORF g.77474 m.77474 type:complete len:56 (+) comp14469_c0_seq7:279-446(+)